MSGPVPRRRLPRGLALAVDVIREARHTGSWAMLLVLSIAVAAVALGTAGHAAVPFLVYGGL